METITEKINFLKKCFGENYKISRQGKNIQVRCPVCNPDNNKLKLSICLETWVCHCWVCNIKGKTPQHIIKNYCGSQLSEEFKTKFNVECNKANIEENKEVDVTFPQKFIFLGQYSSNTKDLDARDCISYLKSRGVNDKEIWKHKIGFFRSGKYRRRVVFPSLDVEGKLNYFVARSIDKDSYYKYLNCDADKSKIIFDEFRLNWKKNLTIVEGVFDLVKCDSNATCLLGSSLQPTHYLFAKIVENKTPVTLALDSDMMQKTYSIAERLSQFGVDVRIMKLGDYHDIGEIPRDLVKQKYLEADNYSRENRMLNLIGTISSGSIF